MKKSQYLAFRAKLESELQQAQATTDGIRRRLDALNVVWAEILCPSAPDHYNGEQNPSPSPDQPSDPHPLDTEAVATSDVIDAIALGMPGEFGVHDILRSFAERGLKDPNRTTVAGRLKGLVKDGQLILVTQGQGRQGSIFCRKGEAK